MKTVTLTVNEHTDEGSKLLAFLKSLNFVTLHENENVSDSRTQISVKSGTVPLDTFISELHNKVDKHFAAK